MYNMYNIYVHIGCICVLTENIVVESRIDPALHPQEMGDLIKDPQHWGSQNCVKKPWFVEDI